MNECKTVRDGKQAAYINKTLSVDTPLSHT
jgi:hypothetical protein